MIVLGSLVAPQLDADATTADRSRKAWHSWGQIRAQATQRGISVKCRLRLVEAVVLPTVFWGCESVAATRMARRRPDGLQRTLVANVLRLPMRPIETTLEFCKRRERVVTRCIVRHMRAPWSQVQRYRCFTLSGHVAPLGPQRLASQAQEWRDLGWWVEYKIRLPLQQAGQVGRRRMAGSKRCMSERPFWDVFIEFVATQRGVDAAANIWDETGSCPVSWREVALR